MLTVLAFVIGIMLGVWLGMQYNIPTAIPVLPTIEDPVLPVQPPKVLKVMLIDQAGNPVATLQYTGTAPTEIRKQHGRNPLSIYRLVSVADSVATYKLNA